MPNLLNAGKTVTNLSSSPLLRARLTSPLGAERRGKIATLKTSLVRIPPKFGLSPKVGLPKVGLPIATSNQAQESEHVIAK